jgi:hypothetical protein
MLKDFYVAHKLLENLCTTVIITGFSDSHRNIELSYIYSFVVSPLPK